MKKGKRIGCIEDFEASEAKIVCVELSLGTFFYDKKKYQEKCPRYQIEIFCNDGRMFEAESEET